MNLIHRVVCAICGKHTGDSAVGCQASGLSAAAAAVLMLLEKNGEVTKVEAEALAQASGVTPELFWGWVRTLKPAATFPPVNWEYEA